MASLTPHEDAVAAMLADLRPELDAAGARPDFNGLCARGLRAVSLPFTLWLACEADGGQDFDDIEAAGLNTVANILVGMARNRSSRDGSGEGQHTRRFLRSLSRALDGGGFHNLTTARAVRVSRDPNGRA